MPKKKAVNTMTLKDFHGGSIPSELPLPSAPGLVVRPASDHRHSAWGNLASRSENRVSRPSSSGSMRSNLDDKTPFLSSNVYIGRNFDEDERKPFEGGPATRRANSDEDFRRPVLRVEEAEDVGRGSSGEGLGGSSGMSYSARVLEGGNVGGGGVRTSVWGARKEMAGVNEIVSSPWVGGGQISTASKFAQASALDQISSGRWQTRPITHQVDVDVIRQSGSPSGLYGTGSEYFCGAASVGCERDLPETVRYIERGLVIEDVVKGSVKDVHSPGSFDGKVRSLVFNNESQLGFIGGKNGNFGMLEASEEKVSERPKLKLLPRSKPLDVAVPSAFEYKQLPVYTAKGVLLPHDAIKSLSQQPVNGDHPEIRLPSNTAKGIQLPHDAMKNLPQQTINGNHSEIREKSHGTGNLVKPGIIVDEVGLAKPVLSSDDAASPAVERPKLNLKPRSQPIDKLAARTGRERTTLFGGERHCEAVLKELGDDVMGIHEKTQGPRRIRNDGPRTEVAPVHTSVSRHAERVPNVSIDHRTGRAPEKKEQRSGSQQADMPRKNWRNENWRSSIEFGKQHQQERPRSPETWRKPLEQPKDGISENSGLRFGKAVSAVQLVQAFSKPASDPKQVVPFSDQRGLPGRTWIHYSRLSDSATRPQINGY